VTVKSVEQYSASGGFDASGNRTIILVYKALTDSKHDGPLGVITSDLFPSYLAPYSFGNEIDTGSYRHDISASLDSEGDSWKSWKVTATYSSRPLSSPSPINQVAPNIVDPTPLTAEISGSFVKTFVEVDRDREGTPVRNVVGDKFPVMTRNESVSSLVITQHYSATAFDLAAFTDNGDTINSTQFFGKDARKWLYSQFSWQLAYWGKIPYFRCTFGFETKVNGDDWRYKPANEGPRYKEAAADTEPGKKFTSDDGLEYGDGIGNLEADGTKRSADNDALYYDGTTGGLDPFEVYEEIDFANVLGVPISLPGVL